MNALPFSVFKRADRPNYLLAFKDDKGEYMPPISSKKKDRDEAIQVGFKWLREGIPQKNAVMCVNDLSLKNMVRKINAEKEAEIIMAELQRLGYVKTYVRSGTFEALDFITFLKTFWDWSSSDYIEEKLRNVDGIHKRHCKLQKQAVVLYWEKFFSGRFLGEITYNDIDDFIKYMGTFNLSGSRKNCVIKAGFVPLRWAFAKNKINVDPTRKHTLYSEDEAKRAIVTPSVAGAAFKAVWKDERALLANMLASVTGMRNGEIIALRVMDIGPDCLFVRSSYNDDDKLKTTKNNKIRRVEIPFPDLLAALVELAKKNPWGVKPDSFVFWSKRKATVPMQGQAFAPALRIALIQIGYPVDKVGDVDFHGWRHFFTSYMIGKIEKKLLKGETGHLTDIMIDRYSDHEIVGDRELIKTKKIETFGNIMPKKVLLLEYKGDKKSSVA